MARAEEWIYAHENELAAERNATDPNAYMYVVFATFSGSPVYYYIGATDNFAGPYVYGSMDDLVNDMTGYGDIVYYLPAESSEPVNLDSVNLQTAPMTADAESLADLTGFEAVEPKVAATWTGAPTDKECYLFFGQDKYGNPLALYYQNGVLSNLTHDVLSDAYAAPNTVVYYTTGTSAPATKTVQEIADEAFGGEATLGFVDGTGMDINTKYNASLLGVQIRKQPENAYYEDGGNNVNGLRFVTAVSEGFLEDATDYGYEIYIGDTLKAKKSCKGTTNNTISNQNEVNGVKLFTAAVHGFNANNSNTQFKVKFYIEKDGQKAYAKYTKQGQDAHEMITSYNQVLGLAGGN
jgi:hypothetical protein